MNGEDMEWISVEKQKPSKMTLVICFIDCKNVDRTKNNVQDSVGIGYLSTDITGEEYWCVFHNPNYNYFGYLPDQREEIWGKVTHWMPLPEPPKEE